MNNKKKIAFILGIRPDVIRAALILKYLKQYPEIETVFIWSGQHYSYNLKDIFFEELEVAPAQIDLSCKGETDADIAASLISRLYPVLLDLKPEAVVFLGDTNTTTGAIAAALLNIPIVHIEGCMRSYDWEMPEEKYRTIIDHLSDIIYAYFPEYKEQGIREGINPESIVVVGNPIVDILNHFYFSRIEKFKDIATDQFFEKRGLKKSEYYVMTCHRRENVHEQMRLKAIFNLVAEASFPVYFPASYRTQRVIKEFDMKLPVNMIMVDPIGYEELLVLMLNSRGVFTDSGTVVEETCILQVPVVQMRNSTERPQVYDAGAAVKFNPRDPSRYPSKEVLRKLDSLFGKSWKHNLGDGKTSERIAQDLRRRALENDFRRHRPNNYHIPIERSYREDGIS